MAVFSKGILSHERGIKKQEGIFFYTASEFAKKNLFYLMWGGKYTCVPPYQVVRTAETVFDSFVLFFIEDGEMEFQCKGTTFTAGKDDIVLLDCKEFHSYTALNDVSFYWFHFNGHIVQPYLDLLWNQSGAHFSGQRQAKRHFLDIHKLLSEQISQDSQASVFIHQIFASISNESSGALSESVLRAKEYITAHFQEDITVDDIAGQVSLSRYHFSRMFQAEMGLSPYAYLLELRMNYAKQLLIETGLSVEEIADRCNFCSTSNFIRLFRKRNDITPAKFRRVFR